MESEDRRFDIQNKHQYFEINGMKVLLVSSNSSATGGGEQYLIYLAMGLNMLGHTAEILLSSSSYMDAWESKAKKHGIRTIRTRLTSLKQRPLRILGSFLDKRNINTVAECCRQVRPSIIHVNQQYDADGLDYILGALGSKIAPVVSTIHMPMAFTRHARDPKNLRTQIIFLLKLDALKRYILRKFYMHTNYPKVFVSREMMNEFTSAYGTHDSEVVIYNGVEIPATPEKGGHRNGAIGFCGRFDPQKNIYLLIDAWLSLKNIASSSPHLILIGDGVLRAQLESYLSRKSPDGGWSITGWISNPQEYMRKIDLLVFTSSFEGMPIAAIEALVLGVPVLSVEMPWVEELSKLSSLVFSCSATDPLKMAEAMRGILDGKKSNLLENETAFFSYTRMASDTIELYERTIEKYGP